MLVSNPKRTQLVYMSTKQELTYALRDCEGHCQYKSDPKICKDCPLLGESTLSKNKQRVLTRHVLLLRYVFLCIFNRI
jgi:hypothetical protein